MGTIAFLASIYFCFLKYQDDDIHDREQKKISIKESLLKKDSKHQNTYGSVEK